MADPFLGMFYDVDNVHFEDAPAAIGRNCKELRGRKMWLYAELKTAHAEYYIVSGFLTIKPDSPTGGAVASEPDGGVVVRLAGKSCRLAPADTFMWEDKSQGPKSAPNKAIEPSRFVLDGLVTDALRRYTAAFGGRSNFLKEVKEHHIAASKLPPTLWVHFEQFVSKP
jgi:hypothetical protein